MDAPRIIRKYEGMFLIDNTHANKDWDEVVKHVHDVLQKHEAEITLTEKWGERKLAYKVKGQKRGTYLLVRFSAPTGAISPIKQKYLHSEVVLRNLIVLDAGIEVPRFGGEDETSRKREAPRPSSGEVVAEKVAVKSEEAEPAPLTDKADTAEATPEEETPVVEPVKQDETS